MDIDKSLNALYHLHPQIKDMVDENNELIEINDELKKENEELKKELEELKKQNQEIELEKEKERQFKIFKKGWIEFNEGVINKVSLKEIEYGFNQWWEKNKSKFTSEEEED